MVRFWKTTHKSQATWQREHGTNHHDLTPEQAARYRLFVRSESTGLDPNRIAFEYWLVQHGRCSDDKR